MEGREIWVVWAHTLHAPKRECVCLSLSLFLNSLSFLLVITPSSSSLCLTTALVNFFIPFYFQFSLLSTFLIHPYVSILLLLPYRSASITALCHAVAPQPSHVRSQVAPRPQIRTSFLTLSLSCRSISKVNKFFLTRWRHGSVRLKPPGSRSLSTRSFAPASCAPGLCAANDLFAGFADPVD